MSGLVTLAGRIVSVGAEPDARDATARWGGVAETGGLAADPTVGSGASVAVTIFAAATVAIGTDIGAALAAALGRATVAIVAAGTGGIAFDGADADADAGVDGVWSDTMSLSRGDTTSSRIAVEDVVEGSV